MEIDIVDYTLEQLVSLNIKDLKEVVRAQKEKDQLFVDLEKRLEEEKFALSERGIFPSTIFERKKAEWIKACNEEAERIRANLLDYLTYLVSDQAKIIKDAPYVVNFALPLEERMAEVKRYYELVYLKAAAQFNAYKKDGYAKVYLGELYETLWHYFEEKAAAESS